jgi:MFS family permease
VQTDIRAATLATFAVFGLNGLVFASWAARIPAASVALDLTDGQTGLLLLAAAIGAVLSLPLAGPLAARIGTADTVRAGGVLAAAATATIAAGIAAQSVPLAAAGLFIFGMGVAFWDVAQNIEGADVERHLMRTVMPRFHAAFSGGAFLGAMVGAGLAASGVGLPAHLLAITAVVLVAALWTPRYFLPTVPRPAHDDGAPRHSSFRAWREPRTLLIGLVVLGAALTEGAANDWLAKATVDGLGASGAAGALVFAVFVAAMTLFRFVGGGFIDGFGRVRVLQFSLGTALVGLLLFVFAPNIWLAGMGAALWGIGAALGFPMGMSAAADDPRHSAARVSVVTTIGYTAFLAGPPLLGFLGDQMGIRNALLAVGVAVLASFLVAPVAAERKVPEARPHA